MFGSSTKLSNMLKHYYLFGWLRCYMDVSTLCEALAAAAVMQWGQKRVSMRHHWFSQQLVHGMVE